MGMQPTPPPPAMGHQDRAYASRIERLRKRLEGAAIPPHARGVMNGMLDILADLVADQEEAERSK